MDMDWRISCLYRDYMYGYIIKQSRWQRLKGRITGQYEISVSTPGKKGTIRTLLLTPDYQPRYLSEYLVRGSRHKFLFDIVSMG